jgi:serine/threonine protein phosphatase 1
LGKFTNGLNQFFGHHDAISRANPQQAMINATTTISDWITAPVILDGPDEFAIGDVHGCRVQLESLIQTMADEAPAGSCLTFLGDLIDRGLNSLGCLRLAARPAMELGFGECHVLLGNHETMMLRAMGTQDEEQQEALRFWTDNGGWAAMKSFGMIEEEYDELGKLKLAEPIRASLGKAATLLDRLETHRRTGNLLFVHAGLHPKIPLGRWFAGDPLRLVVNENTHFAWIRFPFLGFEEKFEDGLIVVHGHTPEDTVLAWKGRRDTVPHQLDGWRLGLDGGSYRTGTVAGAQFRDGNYRVFTASGPV